MKVVVDIYGADHSPEEIIKGCLLALEKNADLKIVMVGKLHEITKILSTQTYNANQVEIVNAENVISCDESPTMAIKTKKDSSLVIAVERTRNDSEVVGMVSAGSTGAVLTGALLKIGRIRGVSRPALAPLLPTKTGGHVLLIDSGANMDCKPVQLCHFAVMGSAYMQSVMGIQKPKVALLNVGTEDSKGNELCKEVFPLLSKMPINFVGNMEAREFLSGEYDVVVADGFWGNVLLKSSEGAVLMLLELMKQEIYKTARGKLGGMLLKPTFKNLKKVIDYSENGGAPFLGVQKIVIKAHGSSKAKSVSVAIQQVVDMAKKNLTSIIANEIQKVVVNDDW